MIPSFNSSQLFWFFFTLSHLHFWDALLTIFFLPLISQVDLLKIDSCYFSRQYLLKLCNVVYIEISLSEEENIASNCVYM